MMTERLMQVLLFMPGFLFSLSFHEAAHGYVASLKGDQTARLSGRVTLNPGPHIDVLGTLILPIMGLLAGGPMFGWGKPVPVDYRNLKNYRNDALWISLAGPASNFFLAFCFAVVLHGLIFAREAILTVLPQHSWELFFSAFLQYFMLNIALCFFNLIPIDPLDGGKILYGLVPRSIGNAIERVTSRWGFFILLFLFISGGISLILLPPLRLFAGLLDASIRAVWGVGL